MDFYSIIVKEEEKTKNVVVYPSFRVTRSDYLMIRGGKFYAIWDEQTGLWSTDEYDVQRLVDLDIDRKLEEERGSQLRVEGRDIYAKHMSNFDTGLWKKFQNYVQSLADSYTQLDEKLIFSNTEVSKEDYASKRLPYPLEKGSTAAWDELISVLYEPSERAKLEWAIGSIVAGDSKHIQKFAVLYGSAGTGKSTVLNIIEKLFEGYTTTFEAKALTGQNNMFATEVFRNNPLVAIQQDGDLSKIEDNTKLNSIASHEEMTMNEKFKSSYTSRINAFLFMGTNKPVKITDAKSGIIRRLIDIHPSGEKIPPQKYQALMSQINFELGSIAYHCLEVYREMGKNFYDGYRPTEMMLQTDVFFNYIESYFDVFKEQDGVSLKQAWALYKQFIEETSVDWKLPQYKFREELKNYFHEFHPRIKQGDIFIRSWYQGFDMTKFRTEKIDEKPLPFSLDEIDSIFDKEFAPFPAQYAKEDGTPRNYWDNVETHLEELDTTQVHYVKVPESHIVIDFDIKDENGEKSRELNLKAAAQWPPTYAEFSKSGSGVHLHYRYRGDASQLSRIFGPDIEVKVFTGNASLRRRLSYCNDLPIAEISSGLPLKEKRVIDSDSVKSERGLRSLVEKNLRKEIHPGTKPSMDFIHKILEDAYSEGLSYDLTDLRPRILAFANNSSNQAMYCIKLMKNMKFKSEDVVDEPEPDAPEDERLIFFDVEVFPNLLVICWKFEGSSEVVRMVNPEALEVEQLLKMKLVGFNNRRYDNHILYGRYMGMSIEEIYILSQKIVVQNDRKALFGAAYGISHADIYDFSSKKQSLKKFEVELGIPHKEWGGGWDKPVDESDIPKVVDYCANDVMATEAVFNDRKQDYVARQILADISGLRVNDTTQKHTAKIVFGDALKGNSHKDAFVYSDLSEEFPGYVFDYGKSSYRDEDPSEGGYVYSEPGIHEDVAVLDIASMHPTSIIQLNLFGQYTDNFKALLDARLAIKRGDYDTARKTFNGLLKPYLKDEENAEALSYALKIVINIVYGLTSASFENPFRDIRNKDNIVAKRGALFMIDLKHFIKGRGFDPIHIKTDSVKIPAATKGLIDEIMEFGQAYGYDFEHEGTYERMALVNDAVYVGKTLPGRKPAHWEAVGAQFQHPYIFKTLFSGETLEFKDLCEAKSVTTALYLDFEADSIDQVDLERARFVGKTGLFVPVKKGAGGGILVREKEVDGVRKAYSAAGSSGYFWKEAEVVESYDSKAWDDIDWLYFDSLVKEAKDKIAQFGDVDKFLEGDVDG